MIFSLHLKMCLFKDKKLFYFKRKLSMKIKKKRKSHLYLPIYKKLVNVWKLEIDSMEQITNNKNTRYLQEKTAL